MTSNASAGVTIAELPPTTRIALRIAEPAGIGFGLPTKVGARSAEGARTALCLGPDEWLLEAPEAERDALLATLSGIDAPHSAVEVSDREITYALEGPAVLDLLGRRRLHYRLSTTVPDSWLPLVPVPGGSLALQGTSRPAGQLLEGVPAFQLDSLEQGGEVVGHGEVDPQRHDDRRPGVHRRRKARGDGC